jgi:hypothetical protein
MSSDRKSVSGASALTALPSIGRPILIRPHQVAARAPTPDRSKTPATELRSKGIDKGRPGTDARFIHWLETSPGLLAGCCDPLR